MGSLELRPHNRKAVDDIKEKIREGLKQILYVSGTGCGKTWVFMGVADEFTSVFPDIKKPKILYIMPKHIIKDNVLKYEDYQNLEADIDFCTYNYFSTPEKTISCFKKYDLCVIDECHHLGGDLYGKNILTAMKQTELFVLGLTATPYRSCDKVSVEDFFDTTVYGISVWDAIQQGLMPPFNYHICLPEKNPSQLKKEYGKGYNVVVDLHDSYKTVSEIVSMYDRDKWICFFPDSKSLYAAVPEISQIFEGYTVFVLLSSLKNLDETIERIWNTEKCVILAVNIPLEGFHLKGVTGVVFYRNVTSMNAFLQMLGRLCSIGNTTEPVIIDVSESARKLLVQLLRKNSKTVPTVTNIKSGNKSLKQVLKVGIGSAIEYDLSKVLYLVDPLHQKQESIADAAEKTLEKYKSFGGKIYLSFEELKASGLDFQKFKACANLYHLTAETAFATLSRR